MQTIGGRLKLARESLGLDQGAFAKKLGLSSRDTVSRWERGLNYPPADVLALMHDKFGIDVGWLVTGVGQMKAGASPGSREGGLGGRGGEPLNMEILEEIIAGIEDALDEENYKVSPSKKARLITILYEEFSTGDPAKGKEEKMKRYLKLVV